MKTGNRKTDNEKLFFNENRQSKTDNNENRQ